MHHSNYFEYQHDDEDWYTSLTVSNEDAIPNTVELFHGDLPLLLSWKPPRLEYIIEDRAQRIQDADFPVLFGIGRMPLVSKRAWDCLRPLIGNSTEALPVAYPSGAPYFLLHVLETTDALDLSRAVVHRNESAGCINWVFEWAFHESRIGSRNIFKLPWISGGYLLFSDSVRKCVKENRLTGLAFQPLKMAREAKP